MVAQGSATVEPECNRATSFIMDFNSNKPRPLSATYRSDACTLSYANPSEKFGNPGGNVSSACYPGISRNTSSNASGVRVYGASSLADCMKSQELVFRYAPEAYKAPKPNFTLSSIAYDSKFTPSTYVPASKSSSTSPKGERPQSSMGYFDLDSLRRYNTISSSSADNFFNDESDAARGRKKKGGQKDKGRMDGKEPRRQESCCKQKNEEPGKKKPDLNNNFLKNPFIPPPSRDNDHEVDMNRIEQLAQPKRKAFIYDEKTKNVYERSDGSARRQNEGQASSVNPTDRYMKTERLATSRSCWESDDVDNRSRCSPPCGRSCQPPFRPSPCRTRDVSACGDVMATSKWNQSQDTSGANWERLATPKKVYPPNWKPLRNVEPGALKGVATRRLEKLAVPKKSVDSGDYYLWLWKKKPDTTVHLKKLQKLCIDRYDMKETRVLLRVDLDYTFGCPLEDKVKAIIPSIKFALDKGAQSVVIISRCGTESGIRNNQFSLRSLAPMIQERLEHEVIYLDDCVGYQAVTLCDDPEDGSVFLLENLIFHPEEMGYRGKSVDEPEKVSTPTEIEDFRKKIFGLGDIYVFDSFTELIPMTNTTLAPPRKDFAYGLNIKRELKTFNRYLVNQTTEPVVAIIGGDFWPNWKIVRNVMGKVSHILIGGELALMFLHAIKNVDIGDTLCTRKIKTRVLRMFTRAKDTGTRIHLPSDHVVMDSSERMFTVLAREDVEPGFKIVDIGPHTRQCYAKVINEARNVIWCGKLGEIPDGTCHVTCAFLEVMKRGGRSYVLCDQTKILVNGFGDPKGATDVTGDGAVTVKLLKAELPKVLAALSPASKRIKKRHFEPVPLSTKPSSYEVPGMQMVGGAKQGVSYGASYSFKCINHVVIEDKNILIRVDFDGNIMNPSNAYRVRMTIPTIRYAQKWHAKAIILVCHLAIPEESREHLKLDHHTRKKYSIKAICDELATLLGHPVMFVPETVGNKVEAVISKVHPGTVIMLENINFHKEEFDGASTREALQSGVWSSTPKDVASFCENLSRLGDIFVNEAFASMHHNKCSITGLMMPQRICGFLVKNELKYLSRMFNYPKRRLMVIFGGDRSNLKLRTLAGLMREADTLFLSGYIAMLFLKVRFNMPIGKHTVSEEQEAEVGRMIQLAEYYNCKMYYPVDLVVSESLTSGPSKQISITDGIPDNSYCMDIGKLTRSLLKRLIGKNHHLIFWSGCVGKAEIEEFAEGTKSVMSAIQMASEDPERTQQEKIVTIVAGHSVVKFLYKWAPNQEFITHVTTGGAAVLKLIGERNLLGLDFLQPKPGKRPLSILGLEDVDITNKRVLVRCDLNIPVVDGVVVDLYPLQALAETIQYCLENEARTVVLVGHLGNPGGVRPKRPESPVPELSEVAELTEPIEHSEGDKEAKLEVGSKEGVGGIKEEEAKAVDDELGVSGEQSEEKVEWISEFSLMPARDALSLILRKEIIFVHDGVDVVQEEIAGAATHGSVLMLENSRYHPEEEGLVEQPCGIRVPISYQAQDEFRRKLSSMGDVFVNESFGSLHHTHSSVVGVHGIPKVAGLTLKKEVTAYTDLRKKGRKPFLVVMGGDMNDALDNVLNLYRMLDFLDHVILCGDFALLFQDITRIGNIPLDVAALKMVPRVVKKAALNKAKLHIPTDYVCAKELGEDARVQTIVLAKTKLPTDLAALDIGPDSIKNFKKVIEDSAVIVFDGTAGSVEYPAYQTGTKSLIESIHEATMAGATSIALGYKTGIHLSQMELKNVFSFYSTGVQAFYDIMAGKPIPGLQILDPMPPKPLQVLCIDKVSVENKRVLIRFDLDVPTVEGVVLDVDKLEDTSTTILHCLEAGAKCVVVMGHRGNPQGYKNVYLSLEPLVAEFENILQRKVTFITRPCGAKTTEVLTDPEPGSVFLFENLKFYPAEVGQDGPARVHRRFQKEAEAAGAEAEPEQKSADNGKEKDPADVAKDSKEIMKEGSVEKTEASDEEPLQTESSSKTESDLTISDEGGGVSIDSQLFQQMKAKTVEEYIQQISRCGDIFVNDDVTDLEDATLTSLNGFELPTKTCGFLLASFLKDSESADVYDLPGVRDLDRVGE